MELIFQKVEGEWSNGNVHSFPTRPSLRSVPNLYSNILVLHLTRELGTEPTFSTRAPTEPRLGFRVGYNKSLPGGVSAVGATISCSFLIYMKEPNQ